jgi:hypothetical protein
MPKVKKEWKELPPCQVSDALLWETTKNYTSYLTKSNGIVLSTDPLNLTGANTKKDSGVAPVRALGVEFDFVDKNVKKNKKKEKAPVVRFSLNIKTKKLIPKKKCVELKDSPKTNHCVYSSTRLVPVRALVKTVRRDLGNYRRDLVPTALRKLYKLYNFKKHVKRPRKDKK